MAGSLAANPVHGWTRSRPYTGFQVFALYRKRIWRALTTKAINYPTSPIFAQKGSMACSSVPIVASPNLDSPIDSPEVV
ncbi:hypothetical protein [Micromonospora avicenniae]|uniref:hypothetical protein n=1 Tax=Micromonospora avicenniae TaxID=1198245 RepID=UPI003431D71D